MDSPDKTFYGIVSTVKSWIPWKSEPANVSKVFWMPDQSCMVCYECDSQFTIINRRHHCRLCGRVFCAKCTSNSVTATSCDPTFVREDRERERIRVCNYCYQQWEQGTTATDNVVASASQDLCTSPSATSVASSRSSSTANSSNITLFSVPYSVGTSKQALENSSPSTSVMEASLDREGELALERSKDLIAVTGNVHDQSKFSRDRSDDEDDEYGVYQVDSHARHSPLHNSYYSHVVFDEINNEDASHKVYPNEDNSYENCLSTSPQNDKVDSQGEEIPEKKDENYNVHDATSSVYTTEDSSSEPVDFDNNGLLWLPPEPEDEEDEREAFLFDDDEEEGNESGEWGYLRASSSFGSGEYRTRDRSSEEHKRAMKTVVDGHFRALVSQLLQVENLPVGEEGNKESWLEIITSLSWEAASLLKPDMSKGGGMDPGGYVKVKCIASGHRCDSMVVKGVVCKKNVAHRRMTSKIEKPRIFILGGALEYQRVSNLLSSFDTLLQQEMDHLKMAVTKIDAHQPDVLLVEKSVSRFAQDYLLAKDISLVLNIKKPLLERIARCTGAQIIPSIDHLSSQKLGYCDTFHVERFLEDLGTAGQGGKKLVKTLMFFDGCPKRLGCTILLRGANGDELKKVKHVVQYGVFAAYHLGLETSFLADEGASLPELPLNSPITVALPDKSSSIERSISTVPGFSLPASDKSQVLQLGEEPPRSNSFPPSDSSPSISSSPPCFLGDPSSQATKAISTIMGSAFLSSSSSQIVSKSYNTEHPPSRRLEYRNVMRGHGIAEPYPGEKGISALGNELKVKDFEPSDAAAQFLLSRSPCNDESSVVGNPLGYSEFTSRQQNCQNHLEESGSLKEESGPVKEEFPPSPSDHQSILVSLSSRCVWKGTVCERSHLFRIKYYGSFDKPLGRFLRDHLFDQGYRCRSCEMPSEAHVHCYTHRQGTLTISVKKLQEILLPGEKEGKIWMWHRCLRCPRSNGFPPATRRVVMSDAAWGLSFGKFLELSFSNHAAASRVASCGHSLHRDCLRFYGFGKMVACFRYASIDVHSVYLPPSKLEFGCDKQQWIQKETDEVVNRAELLFSEVLNSLRQIAEKRVTLNGGVKALESRRQIAELEAMLQMEKAEFEASLQRTMNKEVKKGQPAIDILEINRLRRQLLFQSYMWDHRLVYAAKMDNFSPQNTFGCSNSEYEEHSYTDSEKGAENTLPDKPLEGFGSVDSRVNESLNSSFAFRDGSVVNIAESELRNQETEVVQNEDQDHEKEDQVNLSTNSTSIYDGPESLRSRVIVRRALSDGQFPIMDNLSDTLDAAWTGENHPASGLVKDNSFALSDSALADCAASLATEEGSELDHHGEDHYRQKFPHSVSREFSAKTLDGMEDSVSWLGMPFLNFYRSFNKSFIASSQKLDTLGEYNPVYVSSFRVSELQGEARLLLPVGVNDTVIPVYDDEPTSLIAYALVSQEYHIQVMNEAERSRDGVEFMSSLSLSDSLIHSADEFGFESQKSFGSLEDSFSSVAGSVPGSGSSILDPLSYTKALHVRVSFGDDGPLGKAKYSVVCYYAKRFEALRRICCPSEIDFVRSLSRCKKWGAQGGKSNVFFAKTSDDRFIIKQVTKTELESFIKFSPEYFKYLSESIASGSPTCLAKILGIYQVTSKLLKGGKEKEFKMDVLVMENLLFGRNVTRLYDLKGSSRSRYNPDSSGNNKVLLDQNLIEAMPTSPIFVGNKAKRVLERAVWNDTSFLASIGVMDYSLLVGVDEEKHELVLGIIDFMRQYTWDKHLETWVKASGILGGPKNEAPTVISPKQYKKRFRKAMTTYFLMVPDQWSPPSIIPSKSQSDLCEDSAHSVTGAE